MNSTNYILIWFTVTWGFKVYFPYSKISTRLQVLKSACFCLSCTQGSPSHGGIVALTLWPYAACSPDAVWNLPPARLHSCTWSSRTVRWESHTWPGPWGCAAAVWGCSTALGGRGERVQPADWCCPGEKIRGRATKNDWFLLDLQVTAGGRALFQIAPITLPRPRTYERMLKIFIVKVTKCKLLINCNHLFITDTSRSLIS